MINQVLLSDQEVSYLKGLLKSPSVKVVFSNEEINRYYNFERLFTEIEKDANTNSGYLSANHNTEFKPIKRYQNFIKSLCR